MGLSSNIIIGTFLYLFFVPSFFVYSIFARRRKYFWKDSNIKGTFFSNKWQFLEKFLFCIPSLDLQQLFFPVEYSGNCWRFLPVFSIGNLGFLSILVPSGPECCRYRVQVEKKSFFSYIFFSSFQYVFILRLSFVLHLRKKREFVVGVFFLGGGVCNWGLPPLLLPQKLVFWFLTRGKVYIPI